MRSHIKPALAASILAVVTTVALAADLPARRAPVYYPPPLPVFTWTGFFVGGNAGATFDNGRNNAYSFPAGSISGSSGTAGTVVTNGARDTVGFTGGGQIGYNYQLGAAGLGGLGGFGGGGLILGVIADAQYKDSRNNFGNNYTFSGTPGNAFVVVPGLPRTNLVVNSNRDNFFGTVRGRLGVAFDRVMVFGSGGLAYNTRTTGYTYGGGVEYSITNNISVGAEYLRVNLNRGLGFNGTYVPGGGLNAGTLYINTRGGRDEFNVARAFLNYRFTPPVAAPIVARY